MSTVKRAYKERFYPTSEQKNLLAQSFGCARFTYNNTLRFRTDAYYNDGASISHSQAEKRLVSLKAEFSFLSGPLINLVTDKPSDFSSNNPAVPVAKRGCPSSTFLCLITQSTSSCFLLSWATSAIFFASLQNIFCLTSSDP